MVYRPALAGVAIITLAGMIVRKLTVSKFWKFEFSGLPVASQFLVLRRCIRPMLLISCSAGEREIELRKHFQVIPFEAFFKFRV